MFKDSNGKLSSVRIMTVFVVFIIMANWTYMNITTGVMQELDIGCGYCYSRDSVCQGLSGNQRNVMPLSKHEKFHLAAMLEEIFGNRNETVEMKT